MVGVMTNNKIVKYPHTWILAPPYPLNPTTPKQVAQWSTIAHLEASIMFGDTII